MSEEATVVAAIIFIVGVFALMFTQIIISVPVSHDTEIYSLHQNMGVSGTFMLGSGSVNSAPVYVSYKKLENGAYKLVTVNAGNSEIYMDTNDHPYIRTWQRESNLITKYQGYPYLYEIHVPNGTIIQEYRV